MKQTERITFSEPTGTVRRFVSCLPESFLCTMLAVMAAGLLSVTGAQAALTYSGDVSPADPNTWTSTNRVYIGYTTGNGTLTVDGGTVLDTYWSYLGYTSGLTGSVTVSGNGSTWTSTYGSRFVGYKGTGLLSIANGGLVANPAGYVGYYAGSTGMVTVDGPGSTWTNGSLHVGENSPGTVRVTNGGSVSCLGTTLAQNATGNGTVIVDGIGSTWTHTGTFYAGYNGTGKVMITNGGNVNYAGTGNDSVIIGLNSGSSGIVIVDGTGSTWNHTGTGTLDVGWSGSVPGKLSLSDGGAFKTNAVSITAVSTLTADVGRGSSLTVGTGTGTITNDGTVRLVAGAGAAPGTYAPVSAGTWAGTGTVQALGGVLNGDHTVTVYDAATGAAGSPIAFDLASTQRVLVTAGGKSVGAGFQAATSSTPVAFTATEISGAELSTLQALLGAGQSVLSGWDFSATGTTVDSTNPVYLSLYAGPGQTLYSLTIWDLVDGTWTQLSPFDLAYDGTLASFIASDLNSYAVTGTAPVPIPAAAWLLASGLAGLVALRKRLRK